MYVMRMRCLCAGALFGLASNVNAYAGEPAQAAKSESVIVAEQYANLQAAFDALPASGGVVRLPARTVEIREPIVLRAEDVLVEGVGTASHIQNLNTNGQPALLIESGRPSRKRKGRLESLWRIQLSNFRITGNEKSGHGVEARFVNELYVDGVTVSEHGKDGLHLHFCTEDARVNDALITYNKANGVYVFGGHDTVISSCHFEENNDAVRFVDGFNLTATGNNIDDHLQHGIVVENSMGNTISANMIEQCQGIGVILARDTYATTVSSNIFTMDREGGVDLRDAHGCTITGNTFARVPKRAVAVDPKCHAISISGNTFADASVGENRFKARPEDNVAGGIVLHGASLTNITGNTFSNITGPALKLEGSPGRQIVFVANLLINCESQHTGLVDSRVADNLVTMQESVEPRDRAD